MRNAKNGTYNGDTTYCPVNAYGDCPYCDQCNVCHIDDPQEDCDDWAGFWDSWDEWIAADIVEDPRESFAEEEIEYARQNYDYDYDFNEDNLEMGFNPYMGEYDYDC